jgi:hypothetical protein
LFIVVSGDNGMCPRICTRLITCKDSFALFQRAGNALIVAFVAAVGWFAIAAPADASIQLKIGDTTGTLTSRALTNLGGGVFQYVATGLSDVLGGAGFNFDVKITTNSPGTPTLAELLTVEVSARQGGAGGANKDVYIQVSDDSFTQPTGTNLVLNSQFSLTSGSPGGPASLVSTVWANSLQAAVVTNALNGTILQQTFSNSFSPFELRNLTYFSLNPNGNANTTSSTWVTGTSPPGGGSGSAPEPIGFLVWTLLIGSVGLLNTRQRH